MRFTLQVKTNQLLFKVVLRGVVECTVQGRKWAFIGAYKPPSLRDDVFLDNATIGLDRISTKFDNILLLGDLNFDLTHPTRWKTLLDMCDVFNLANRINSHTCFMKDCPTLCFNALNFGCGISDW